MLFASPVEKQGACALLLQCKVVVVCGGGGGGGGGVDAQYSKSVW